MLAYIIASAVPNFGDLVSLIGALLGTFLTFQPYGGMWLYDNWATGRLNPTRSWYARVAWAVFVIVIGTYLQISGTYATVATVIKNQSGADGSKVWSCADNSASS